MRICTRDDGQDIIEMSPRGSNTDDSVIICRRSSRDEV